MKSRPAKYRKRSRRAHQRQPPTTVRVSPAEMTRSEGSRAGKPKKSAAAEFAWWPLPDRAPVREAPPTEISSSACASFQKTLKLGENSVGPNEDGRSLFAFIGLDFGTSSTKLAIRFPFEPGSPVIAVPAPTFCRPNGDGNAYLWQTLLWIGTNGKFTPWPEEGSICLNMLKQGLLDNGAPGRVLTTMLKSYAPGKGVTRLDAATAYLAYVIRYARGWLFQNRPQVIRGRTLKWLVNFGLPAKTFDDQNLSKIYRTIGATAITLANVGGLLDCEGMRAFVNDKDVRHAAENAENALEFGFSIVPEVAAEATAYTRSARSANGLYVMVDVGATTLDVCTFRVRKGSTEQDLYPILLADVRPLGVEAYHWFRHEGRSEDGFRQQCDRCLKTVIWHTKMHRDPNAEAWEVGSRLPVFLAGGGAANSLHRSIVQELSAWLSQNSGNDGIEVLQIPLPDRVEMPEPGGDAGRLAVAVGLSYPPDEIGRIVPPRDIEDIEPPGILDFTKRAITKDDV